ncbi:MAG: orotidine 5'-phosphate decarboxylase / HUMPS family protein [Armatimonadota bacterium]
MNLQIAFDCTNLEGALEIAEKIKNYCDIMEVGTPLIKSEGIKTVAEFKKRFPDKIIVADIKIVDAGKIEANLALSAGADIITMMSCVSDQTKEAVYNEVKEKGKKIMVDLLGSPDTLEAALRFSENGDIDYLCFHKSTDAYGVATSLDEYTRIKKVVNLPIIVAGRINKDNIDIILKLKPHTVIIGGAVTRSDNPLEDAKYFYELIKSVEAPA